MNELPLHFENLSETWFLWMVGMSWQLPLFAGAAWLLSRMLTTVSARLRYTLWLLVLIKLILPPALATPWSVGTAWSQFQSPTAQVARPQQEERPFARRPMAPGASKAQAAPSPIEHALGIRFPATPLTLMLLWAAAASGLGLFLSIQYWRYRRRVLGSAEAPGPVLQHALDQGLEALEIRRPVHLRVSTHVETPTLFGLWRQTILLPEGCETRFSPAELETILAHELAHVRRADLPIGCIAAVLSCLYWFHPAVWLVNLYLRREREMACDDTVLRLTKQNGKDYASTIVRVAESFAGKVPVGVATLGVLERYDNLLHRIRSASDASRSRRIGWRSALCVVFLALLAPMGVWAPAKAATNPGPTASIDEEIEKHYAKAHPEVQEFIRSTAQSFARNDLWLPEDAFDALGFEEREAKIAYCAQLLAEGEYGRHLCRGLAEAGVLKDSRLLPGLLKVAAYQEGGNYDCRPKWMATAALGRLGNESAVPVLVPLVDHGNLNTRMWARGSLARLTGQTFDKDKQAWADWWNRSGKGPAIAQEALDPAQNKVAQAASKTPPQILNIVPAVGASDVDPATPELRVTFDQDMAGGFSWTGGGPHFPETNGKPRWIDSRTCALPVKLKAASFYRFGINAPKYDSFRNLAGVPVTPRAVYFCTTGADEDTLKALEPPVVVTLNPENGSPRVSPSLTTLSATFDRPMGSGFSWTRSGAPFPDIIGKPAWSPDRKTCTVNVKLDPGVTYRIGLNNDWFLSFNSEYGVPIDPVVWTFTTGS